jgi:hypothetical protein
MTSTPIIDIHVHPTLKPYGNSFYTNSNKKSISDSSCVWFRDNYSGSDTFFENTLGISRYRQSDFSTLTDSQHRIVCLSFYPVEKEFINIQSPILKNIENYIAQFASLFGKNRVEDIKSETYNYFNDYKKEFAFLLELDNKFPIGGAKKYKVMNKLSDLDSEVSLLVVPTVEGCHFLCEGNDTTNPKNWINLEANVRYIKNNPNPLFFVTFAHHFYNGLCTHAKSLFDMTGNLLNQKIGMRDYNIPNNDGLPPISSMGKQLIDLLLSKENGNRILIDVKHMSKEARTAYYAILASEKYSNEKIPIIYSHGAVGIDEPLDINLNFTDVQKIYQSKGIIGLEMDQRILGYNHNRFSKWFKNIFRKKQKQSYLEAEYFWKQIITIAEFAYTNGFSENPWQCICLGSDYDGIINPLNSYCDSSSLPTLYMNLIEYLNGYWSKASIIPTNHNGKDAQDIIYQIMYKNAYNFIKTHYLETIKIEEAIV